MVLCIVEGSDGAGKTTIAQRISALLAGADLTSELLHRGPLKRSAIDEYELDLEDYWPGSGQHIICDRWHLGEHVYGPVLRGKSSMTIPQQRHIEMFLMRRGALLVHVIAPQNEIMRRVNERGDDLIAAHQISDIVARYHQVLFESTMAVLPVWSPADDGMLTMAINIAMNLESLAIPLTSFNTYVGPIAPAVLLLGETRSIRAGHPVERSAFVPRPNTSGDFLLRYLTDDVAMTCGVANALEEDIGLLWERLGEPLIVALGREAERQCNQAELLCGVVPDPQFMRSFHHGKGKEYGQLIREAALHQRDVTSALID